MKTKTEEMKYICSKCHKRDFLRNMHEIYIKFSNGSIKTTYLCGECWKSLKVRKGNK